MKKKTLTILILILSFGYSYAQTKVSGYVFDEANEPVAFATILFKGSIEGTISDENGKFYLESKKNWSQLIISFIGYENLEIELSKKVTFNLKLIYQHASANRSCCCLVTWVLSNSAHLCTIYADGCVRVVTSWAVPVASEHLPHLHWQQAPPT